MTDGAAGALLFWMIMTIPCREDKTIIGNCFENANDAGGLLRFMHNFLLEGEA
jgi:hypothetical protein